MNLRSRVYATLVAAHPAAFRDEFGLEMRLDFEEAVQSRGVIGLYWDAAVSVGRQWLRAGVPQERERVAAGARYLLEGRYGAIGGEGLSLFQFGRGMVLAVGLFGGLVMVQGRAPAGGSSVGAGDSAKGGFSADTAVRGEDSGGKKDGGRFPSSVGGDSSQVSEARPGAPGVGAGGSECWSFPGLRSETWGTRIWDWGFEGWWWSFPGLRGETWGTQILAGIGICCAGDGVPSADGGAASV